MSLINDRISVVMATYNGERYIRQQLDTILPFLEDGDELLVTDDGSKDSTLQIIQEYFEKYPSKIRTVSGPHKGVAQNFSSGLMKCKNDIALLSDQDDIWSERKISVMRKSFNDHPEALVIMHDGGYCDSEGNILPDRIYEHRETGHGWVKNLVKSCYYGCCLGVRREFIDTALPIPSGRVLHDQYFGLIAEQLKCSEFIPDELIWHRIHDTNKSSSQSFSNQIYYRKELLKGYLDWKKRANK